MILEKYVLAEEIGKGSFGTVYRASFRNSLTTNFAIKKVPCNAPENVELALQEVWALSSLQKHPNIIRFEECYVQDGRSVRLVKHGDTRSTQYLNLVEMSLKGKCHHPVGRRNYHLWFVMEYCDAGDMNEFLLSLQPVAELNASFMLQLADGISFMHKNNVVHRDLKPENILVKTSSSQRNKKDSFPTLKIADFGLSKVCIDKDSSCQVNVDNCLLSSACGSDFFMAPEVFEKRYTAKADVFALGIIFWAIMDRITFIDATTKKVLLGTYVKQDKKVLSVGEALLDDPDLNIAQLLLETSLRRPAGVNYPEKKCKTRTRKHSCTCVDGDVIKLRNLVSKMVHPDADQRPSSQELLGKLKEVLKTPVRLRPLKKLTESMTTTHKKAGKVQPLQIKEKLKRHKKAPSQASKSLNSSVSSPPPRLVTPPSRPMAIVCSKRKSAPRRHVHRVVSTKKLSKSPQKQISIHDGGIEPSSSSDSRGQKASQSDDLDAETADKPAVEAAATESSGSVHEVIKKARNAASSSSTSHPAAGSLTSCVDPEDSKKEKTANKKKKSSKVVKSLVARKKRNKNSKCPRVLRSSIPERRKSLRNWNNDITVMSPLSPTRKATPRRNTCPVLQIIKSPILLQEAPKVKPDCPVVVEKITDVPGKKPIIVTAVEQSPAVKVETMKVTPLAKEKRSSALEKMVDTEYVTPQEVKENTHVVHKETHLVKPKPKTIVSSSMTDEAVCAADEPSSAEDIPPKFRVALEKTKDACKDKPEPVSLYNVPVKKRWIHNYVRSPDRQSSDGGLLLDMSSYNESKPAVSNVEAVRDSPPRRKEYLIGSFTLKKMGQVPSPQPLPHPSLESCTMPSHRKVSLKQQINEATKVVEISKCVPTSTVSSIAPAELQKPAKLNWKQHTPSSVQSNIKETILTDSVVSSARTPPGEVEKMEVCNHPTETSAESCTFSSTSDVISTATSILDERDSLSWPFRPLSSFDFDIYPATNSFALPSLTTITITSSSPSFSPPTSTFSRGEPSTSVSANYIHPVQSGLGCINGEATTLFKPYLTEATGIRTMVATTTTTTTSSLESQYLSVSPMHHAHVRDLSMAPKRKQSDTALLQQPPSKFPKLMHSSGSLFSHARASTQHGMHHPYIVAKSSLDTVPSNSVAVPTPFNLPAVDRRPITNYNPYYLDHDLSASGRPHMSSGQLHLHSQHMVPLPGTSGGPVHPLKPSLSLHLISRMSSYVQPTTRTIPQNPTSPRHQQKYGILDRKPLPSDIKNFPFNYSFLSTPSKLAARH